MIDPSHVHPSFPQPDDCSQAIWRYMDTDKFEWLLEHRRLFMPTADNLGDPLEGSTPRGQSDWWEKEYKNAENEEQRENVIHNKKLFSSFAKALRNQYFVSCWHMNKHENYSMWRCYTRRKQSVAIKTTYSTLRGALPSEALLGIVRYIDYTADSLPYGNMFEHIMHKDIQFAYEAEVRAVVTIPISEELGLHRLLEDHFTLTSNPDFRVYAPKIDVINLIHGIVLHPQASKTYAARIRRLCKTNGLPAPIASRETATPTF
jgi:hypothetical protein